MPCDYLVTCSCGRQTVLHWQAPYYTTDAPGWEPHYPEGWTCGRERHTQRVPPKPIEPTRPTHKLEVTI